MILLHFDSFVSVSEYFNSKVFSRWNKIFSEVDVNFVQKFIWEGHQQIIDKVQRPANLYWLLSLWVTVFHLYYPYWLQFFFSGFFVAAITASITSCLSLSQIPPLLSIPRFSLSSSYKFPMTFWRRFCVLFVAAFLSCASLFCLSLWLDQSTPSEHQRH